MLGWKITKNGEYKLDIPALSKQEEQVILELEEKFKDSVSRQSVSNSLDSEELFRRLMENYTKQNSIHIDSDQREYLAKVARMHVYGFYFLEELINNKNIEEISVIGPNKPVYVFLRNIGWQRVNACFTEDKTIVDAINKMASSIGRRITHQNPRIDAVLPNGSRLHASLPPISAGEITIRKFRNDPFSAIEIIESGVLDSSTLAYLSLIMQSDSSLVIAGNTASGKTTTLNSLFAFVPINERVIIAEQTPEINIPHPHSLRMVANQDMSVGLKDIIYDSLRMRPDRMIVGEVRNAIEIEALFDVLLAGQARATYATMHATSTRELVQRLKNFGVSEIDVTAIGFAMIQKRMMEYDGKKTGNEIRKITEIVDIKNNKLLFSYNTTTKKLEAKNKDHLDNLLANKLGVTSKEINDMQQERKKMIEKSPRKFSEFVTYVQNKLFGFKHEYNGKIN
ncbi:MAG: ATPase, T2SS/T4P/T4SS family [Candidatus Micrarchaeota archaeon]|nr:ATPase, T2SS/T4P/T4SS family [Candidatus Micrarchaeota archaeon]